jgi:hypothetical protein
VEEHETEENLGTMKDREVVQEDSHEVTIDYGLEVEGGLVLVSPPLTKIPEFNQEPVPFFHLEQLVIIF